MTWAFLYLIHETFILFCLNKCLNIYVYKYIDQCYILHEVIFMAINVKKLIVIEKALEDTEYKFEIIKEIGKFIILKVNEPVYVLYKYEENTSRIQVKRQIKHYKRL